MQLIDRLKSWYLSWPEGPTTYDAQVQEHHCLNCGTDYEGDYCPRCGQKATVGRITWRQLMGNFTELWDFTQRSAFSTLLQLFYRPGYLVSDYLNGRRARYFQPVKLLLLVGLLVALGEHLWFPEEDGGSEKSEFYRGMVEGARDGQLKQELVKAVAEEDSLRGAVLDSIATNHTEEIAKAIELTTDFERLFTKVGDWAEDNQGWATLLICSFLILPTRRLFRRAPRNGQHTVPEGFFIQTYLSSPLLVLSFLDDIVSVQPWVSLFFFYLAYRQLFGYGLWSTIWRIVLVMVISFLSLFVFIILGGFLYALFLLL